jgi:trigger factor
MITTDIKVLSNYKKELSITMEKADLEPIREQQTKRVQKEVQFPGFRKGKAPLGLVKRNYNDVIEAYTIEAAVDQSVHESIIKNNLQVVGTPEAKKVDVSDNGDIVSIIEVDTLPEIELKKYKGFEITKDEYEITNKIIDETIQRLLKEKAEVKSVDGPITKGHQVVLDMQELDEQGKAIKNKKYDDISIKVGDGRFDPELEDQLIGLKTGDKKDIEKVYPDDFPQKDYAGKKESYKVDIKTVQEEILPELNDEFVKDLEGEFETVSDLRKATQEQLEHNYKMEAENRFFQDLSQKLLDENSFEVPPALVDNYLDYIVNNMKRSNPKTDEGMIRQHYRSEAEFNVKWHYLRDQIAKQEKIELSEDDTKTFLDELKDEKIRELYEKNAQLMSGVKEEILTKKINDFLIKNTKIKINKIKL